MTAALSELDDDRALLSRAREGDQDAYAQLFARHRASAVSFATRLADADHAEDLVAEAFARVLDALQRDLGPTVSFRSYLLTSIRSVWINTLRAERRYDLIDDYETLPPTEELKFVDDPEKRFDDRAVAEAFERLPQRWQAVLWYTAVEDLPHGEVADLLGIKPNAVAALNFRAREGLRKEYLSSHIADAADPACSTWAPLLPAHARGSVDRRKKAGLTAHLDECVCCAAALADLDDVNRRLGALLLPVVLGPGAGGFALTAGAGGLWAAIGAWWLGVVDWGRRLVSNGSRWALAAAVAVVGVGAAVAVPLVAGESDERPASASSAAAPDTADPADTTDTTDAVEDAARPAPVEPVDAAPTPTVEPAPAPTVGRGSVDRPRPVDPVDPAVPRDPADPTEPVTPTPPAAPVVDVALGGPDVDQLAVLRHTLSRVVLPVRNVPTDSVVTVTVTNVVGLAWAGGAGWRCPAALGGLPDGDLQTTTTTITCTWTGARSASVELPIRLMTSGSSELAARVAPPAGHDDPRLGNNTATAVILP
ncbi:RNA polymerase sigma factor [Nocardioides caeni]|uniref:RNA polymerase sigma factor n=1 Tax=Nocardioides caeni TaxID=574700 RepID=UPI001305380A|nr:sigma-70 family RNA polymerase sigma factor [Nocardioides caeni]